MLIVGHVPAKHGLCEWLDASDIEINLVDRVYSSKVLLFWDTGCSRYFLELS